MHRSAALSVILGAVSLCGGCAYQPHSSLTPGTTSVEEYEKSRDPGAVRRQREIQRPDGTVEHVTEHEDVPPLREVRHTASSTGPGADVAGDRLQQGMTGAPSELKLPGGSSAKGGGFELTANASLTSKGPLILIGLGVLLIIGACVALYLQLRRVALIGGLAGALFVAAGLYPEFAVLLIVAAALGLGAWLFVEAKGGKGWRESLRASLGAAAKLPADARAAWERELKGQADAPDVAAIAKIEKADDLHSFLIQQARSA